ncbi:MAG: TetR/AcrR family transcriptional regulator [Acidimicrobiales bacterium]
MALQERRERERSLRRQGIVTAARELAEADGWDAVTTRRLADSIEYSQPVLYSHFKGKEDIVAAVAVEGFGELADIMRDARLGAATPEAALRALAESYVDFATTNPALYDAMFTLSTRLHFGQPETPAPLRAAFAELRAAVMPLAAERDPDTLSEVAWSSLHGLASLSRAGRLRPDYHEGRLTMLLDQLAAVPASTR